MPYLTKDLVMDLIAKNTSYKVSDEIYPGKMKNQGVPGLLVRVSPGGTKTFAVQYRTKEGRKGWYPLGRFGILTVDQAREEAKKILLRVSQGEDPSMKLREDRDSMTISELVEKFITEHAAGKAEKTKSEYSRLMRIYLSGKIGGRKAKSIGTADMATLLSAIRKETPVQANRVLAVARKMFNMAELWEVREAGTNPLRGQARAQETARERRMVEPEIRALGAMIQEVRDLKEAGKVDGAALSPETPYSLAAIQLSLMAGFRKGEVLGLLWSWIDLEKGVAVIPPHAHKTGRKTGKSRVVYLCPESVALLRSLPRLDEDKENDHYNPHVIIGQRIGAGLVQIQDIWERLRTAVTDRSKHEAKKHKKKTAPAVDINDVTIHDLRRSFASVAADLGHPELIIKAMLGHQSLGSVTEVYTRLSVDPIRAAVNEVGGAIAGWLGLGAPQDVVDPDHL